MRVPLAAVWLIFVFFAARAARSLLTDVLPARWVDYVLWPAETIARLGRMIVLALAGEDRSGGSREPLRRVPVLGPVLISLTPFVFCAAALYFCVEYLCAGVNPLPRTELPGRVPLGLADFWRFCHDLIDLAASQADAWSRTDWTDWRLWFAAYATVSLVVSMAPEQDDVRAAVMSVVGVAAVGTIWALFSDLPVRLVRTAWGGLSFLVANLILLLLVLSAARCVVGLYRILRTASGASGAGGGQRG